MRTISKSSVATIAAALLREKNLLLPTLVRLLNANKRKQALEHNLLLGSHVAIDRRLAASHNTSRRARADPRCRQIRSVSDDHCSSSSGEGQKNATNRSLGLAPPARDLGTDADGRMVDEGRRVKPRA
jgi:hypothetical protein